MRRRSYSRRHRSTRATASAKSSRARIIFESCTAQNEDDRGSMQELNVGTLRAREYPLLDAEAHVYLDYTAANLPPASVVARHVDLLRGHLLGNPHSTNPSSSLTTEL